MQIRVEYIDGRRKVWDTTYLSYDGRAMAAITVDELDCSNPENGVIISRKFVNTKGEIKHAIDEGAVVQIVSPEEYEQVLFVMENGEVVLEADGEGHLVRPEDMDVER